MLSRIFMKAKGLTLTALTRMHLATKLVLMTRTLLAEDVYKLRKPTRRRDLLFSRKVRPSARCQDKMNFLVSEFRSGLRERTNRTTKSDKTPRMPAT